MTWEDVRDGVTSDEGLQATARIYALAGLVTVLIAGVRGLLADEAGLLVISVLTMIGYVIVAWVLTRRRRDAPWLVSVLGFLTAFLSLGILGSVAGAIGSAPLTVVLFPVIAGVIVYTGGFLIAGQLARRHPSLRLDFEEADVVNVLLQAAALLPVWSAFVLLDLPGGNVAPVALIALVSTYASTAGHLAGARKLVHHIAAGSVLALLGNAWFVFRYSGVAAEAPLALVGRASVLVGMLLAAFPTALAVVAIHDLRAGKEEAEDPYEADTAESSGPSGAEAD